MMVIQRAKLNAPSESYGVIGIRRDIRIVAVERIIDCFANAIYRWATFTRVIYRRR